MVIDIARKPLFQRANIGFASKALRHDRRRAPVNGGRKLRAGKGVVAAAGRSCGSRANRNAWAISCQPGAAARAMAFGVAQASLEALFKRAGGLAC
jgi:hypothetical protein